jgi:glutaredoxin
MGVDFEERDISRDESAVEELTQKYGSTSTPTIVVGDKVLVGFNPKRLDQLLEE